MFSSIIYLISIILLLITFLLLKKSKKHQNLLLWIFISFMFLFCYNSIIVYILSFFNIHSTLLILSIVNFGFVLSLGIFLFKNKQFQKYYLKKFDILAIIILAILIIIIGYVRFGFPFKIVYETVDPGTHFWTSMDFFRESILLNKANTAVDFSPRVFGSYVNTGILFKICYPFVGYINLYAVYIAFDLIMLFMSGIIFYFLIRYICKEKHFLLIIISSIIYLLGYPLNNMIFGFFYSGHVVTLLAILILMFKFYDNNQINSKYIYFFLFLLNIGIFFTYYLYLPIIIITEMLYYIYKLKIQKILNKKQFALITILTILIPTLLALFYFVIPYIGNTQHSLLYQLSLYGYCYNTYLSNFIVFLPPIIYYIINMIKKKKFNYEIYLFGFLLLFIIIIIILSIFDIANQYYASKFFYAFWLVCFVLLFNYENLNNLIAKIYEWTIFVLFLVSLFNTEDFLYDVNIDYGNRLESSNIFNIYSYNLNKLKYSNDTFTIAEINIIRKLYEIKADNVINNFIEYYNAQRLWLNAFFWNNKLDYPENELYNYIINKSYFFNPISHNNYYNIDNNYSYYVIFYRDIDKKKYQNYSLLIPFEEQIRWNKNLRLNYTINKKERYDKIDRKSCKNCTFIDFDVGVIIILNNI